MHFDEHHVFPKAENEKSYNWSILAYSVFWTERLAGRSPFWKQAISVAKDTPLNYFHCISKLNYLDNCSDLWYIVMPTKHFLFKSKSVGAVSYNLLHLNALYSVHISAFLHLHLLLSFSSVFHHFWLYFIVFCHLSSFTVVIFIS